MTAERNLNRYFYPKFSRHFENQWAIFGIILPPSSDYFIKTFCITCAPFFLKI